MENKKTEEIIAAKDIDLKEIDKEIEEIKPAPAKKTVAAATFLAIFDFVKTIALIFVFAFIIRFFIIQPYIVDGQSMEPNFHNSDYLITEKISYRINPPQRGDIVIFHPPDNMDINYIKRIIGLPGDVIDIKTGSVFVNNQKIDEPYLASGTQTEILQQSFPLTVPQDEYFVLGDNRSHSRDSRDFGAINKSEIVSHVWFRLWPFNSIRTFGKISYNAVTS